ncbi:double-strand break repair helicase AddA [Aquabacter spiritensis]|uniref:DNA 3'-5' helicase n=1 Tax=Aquabacter spiritensis TaxID=933073 RepID=A0A4R3M645_9HYPH|nr:double-strand break repair helicase AddA [Aquabacter spiritensis]TCT08073.1 DNA helicase/exodeoxyribonuclease V subunit A [Aquabacter spiritensis]
MKDVTSDAVDQGPLAEATRRQSDASAPDRSAWVSANAGSGKTHVLARRVIRLLLSGTPPERILCLTYTKAAAANMANRVLAILSRWVGLSDDALDAELRATDGRVPTRESRARARRLFAAALETPGGLKIQTIHAFCGGLLHRFPFEAGVAAGFRELDEAARLDLMAQIRADLIVEATRVPDGPLGQALSRLTEDMSDFAVDALLEAAVALRAQILHVAVAGPARRARLAHLLGLPPETSRAAIEAEMLASPHLPRSEWASVAARLTAGSASDAELGRTLGLAAKAASVAEALAAYRTVFLTSEGKLRARFLTKGLRAAEPDLADRLDLEKARIGALLDALRAAVVLERSEAALVLGGAACARYEAAKSARGLLDFDDLIHRTADLLNRVPASFVHFKLDRGIDHVLVDEAQDTSPAQWKVVEGLVSDFFAGEGARPGLTRTLFVVGDEKQSIFSFQGADPRAFGAMHRRVARAAGPDAFRDVSLPHSFRASPGVLAAVDRIFAGADAAAGLVADGVAPTHAAIRADAPALVEIWPTLVPPPRPEIDDWRRPLDAVPVDDPANLLARRIAAFIAWGIGARLAIPSQGGRPMRAEDVLILVRRRGKLFEAIIRALKAASGVDVAGADRLVVADHIAALDLMALGDALLSPDDDLALAGLLKSPLFGFTDADLTALCPGRTGRLGDALAQDFRFSAAAARLSAWRVEAAALRPFDFYGRVLGRDGGRRAMIARLGAEAGDVLDEFMALARSYEAGEPATLSGFLAYLRRGGAETKRDMESGRDEVRVMTVHGAKGLEAPIVILADTVDVPRLRLPGGLLTLSAGDGIGVPVLVSRQEADPPALSAARAAAAAREAEEYRRLLYVALTRAQDAVIVCGAEGRLPGEGKAHARAPGCWYDLVTDALAAEAVDAEVPYCEVPVLRWRRPDSFPVSTLTAAVSPSAPPPAPRSLETRPVEAEATCLRLRPSHAAPKTEPSLIEVKSASLPGGDGAVGIDPTVHGDLVHRLLAGLPDLAGPERRASGMRLLRQAAPSLSLAQHAAVLAEALSVLDLPALADLFGPGSRAEVPVLGRWQLGNGRPAEVAGRIDRLVRIGTEILLADFKTDRVPPERAEDVDPSHIAQLALYAAALGRALPGTAVAARIVYTRGPRIHGLSPGQLEAALERLGAG